MSIGVIRWEDPPPSHNPGQRGMFVAELVARDLRANPGRWAVVAENNGNVGLAAGIKGGRYPALRPAGAFDAVSRSRGGIFTTYARYLGDGGESS